MAQAVIGAIRVILGMNSASFEKDTKRVEKKLDAFGRKMAGIGKRAAIAFAAVGAAAATAFMKVSKHADKMTKSAQKIGVPVDELTALAHAADLSGVEFAKLETGLGQFSRSVSDSLNGMSSEGVKALKRLDISFTDLQGQQKTTAHLIEDVADRFQAMPDGVEKTAIAMQIFGRAGRDMIPLLNQGSDGIAKMSAEAARLGLVIDQKTGQSAERFNDNLTRLKGVFVGIANTVFARVIPTMVALSERLITSMTEGGRFEKVIDALTGAFNLMVRGIILAIDNLDVLYNLFKVLVAAKVVTFVIAITGTMYQLAKGIRTAGLALAAFTAIKKISAKGLAMMAGLAALAAGKLDEMAEAIETVGQKVASLFPEGSFDGMKSMFDAVDPSDNSIAALNTYADVANRAKNSFEPLNLSAQKLGKSLNSVSDGSHDAWKGLRNVSDAAKQASQHISPVAGELQNAFGSWIDSAVDGTFKLKDALKSLANDMAKMALKRGFGQMFGSVFGSANFSIPGFANGTKSAPGGMALVGERGPELVNLPRGSEVMPNRKLGGMGSSHVAITVQPSNYFDIAVGEIAGAVSVKVVQDAAPGLVNTSLQAVGQRNIADPSYLA